MHKNRRNRSTGIWGIGCSSHAIPSHPVLPSLLTSKVPESPVQPTLLHPPVAPPASPLELPDVSHLQPQTLPGLSFLQEALSASMPSAAPPLLCPRWPKPERGGGSQRPGLDRLQAGTSVPQRAPLPVAAQTLLLLADSFQTPWLRASPAHPTPSPPSSPTTIPMPASTAYLLASSLPSALLRSPQSPPRTHQNSFCALEEGEPWRQTHRTQVLTAGDWLCAWG